MNRNIYARLGKQIQLFRPSTPDYQKRKRHSPSPAAPLHPTLFFNYITVMPQVKYPVTQPPADHHQCGLKRCPCRDHGLTRQPTRFEGSWLGGIVGGLRCAMVDNIFGRTQSYPSRALSGAWKSPIVLSSLVPGWRRESRIVRVCSFWGRER